MLLKLRDSSFDVTMGCVRKLGDSLLQIVSIATAWGSREGGINSFNYWFLRALAEVNEDGETVCVVTTVTSEEREDAEAFGVKLIEVTPDEKKRPGKAAHLEIKNWFDAEGYELGDETVFIGHDIITGSVAVSAFQMFGGKLALIHHMAYDQYQNLDGGNGDKAGKNFQDQCELFSTPDAYLFGVGSYLAENAGTIGARAADVLVPGFPEIGPNPRPPKNQLRIVVAGRFTPDTETLKQAELAVEAFGLAVKKGRDVKHLNDPQMIVLGVDTLRGQEAHFEDLACDLAGRKVNVLPMSFSDDPEVVAKTMRRSNLVIVPSFHEGFGLVGWEAIGCEVPLILGTGTGLYKHLIEQIGSFGFRSVNFQGGGKRSADRTALARQIIEVAKEMDLAKKDASSLRQRLKIESGCTWSHTAEAFLSVIGGQIRTSSFPSRAVQRHSADTDQTFFKINSKDSHPRCVELSLSPTQGSTPERFDVLAELWFGSTPIPLGDLRATMSLIRAQVEITSKTGQIEGKRLGQNPTVAGLVPQAGGIWLIDDPKGGDQLSGRVLGDERLCAIATPKSLDAHVKVQVVAAPKDIRCDFDLSPEDREPTREKLMSIFLQRAMFDDDTGQVILSMAEMRGEGKDD